MRALRPTAISPRFVAGLAIALVSGVAIGYMDSRPGFDDTGITAVSLVVAAGLAAFIAGRAPWLIALATGIWIPLFELSTIGSGGPVASLILAGAGASMGWLVGRR